MEKIDFKKQNIPFTQVANGVLYDKNLSLGAKAVYAFMYSKPDGWQFSAFRIGQELNVSKPTVLKILDELKEFGYLISKKLPNGRMLYKILFPPIEPESNNFTLAEPESKKATVKKSHGEESLPISNKEIKVIKRTSNKDSELVNSHGDIVKIIDLFEEVNPTAYKKWYRNKTQRASISNLVSLYGVETVTKVVQILPKTNKIPYVPTVNTPDQLENKWDSLKIALEKKKTEINSKKPKIAFV